MDVLELLQAQQPELIPLARVAAIPNSLDAGLLAALLNVDLSATAELETLNQSGLLTTKGARLMMHALFRRRLLETWWTDLPAFNRICQRGFDYLSDLTMDAVETPLSVLQEQTYFALGAALATGIELLESLYTSARGRHQLGVCEQLLSIVQPIAPALTPLALQTLRYFEADLALGYYRLDEAQQKFSSLMAEAINPLRHALALLGLGRVYLAQHRWQHAFQNLHQAEVALADLKQPYAQALAQLAIAATYNDLAERSGGLYSGDEDRLDPLVRVRRSIDGVPFALARTLLLAAPPLAWIYLRLGMNPRSRWGRVLTALFIGSNYQDWAIARLKVEASRWLRQAVQTFESLQARRELAEARESLAILYHQLGHPRASRRLQDELLADESVQRSEYWRARVHLVRGQIRAEQGRRAEALLDLSAARDVLTSYADWERAGSASQLMAQVHMQMLNREAAAQSLHEAVADFIHAQDPLRRTEAQVALEEIAPESATPSEPTAYIARFPGDLYRRVRGVSLLSINGLTWLAMLVVALLSGFAAIVMQSLIEFTRHGISLALLPGDVVLLALTPLLPFFFLWTYQMLYAIIGGAVWAYRLPLDAIENDPPEMIVLDVTSLSRQNLDGQRLVEIRWSELVGIISAERHWLDRLIRLGSRLVAVSREHDLPIESTTRFYRALKKRLAAQLAGNRPVHNANIDYIKSWWFVAFVVLVLAIGFGLPLDPEAGISIPANCLKPADCPEQAVSVVFSLRLSLTLFLFVLLTPLMLLLRTGLQRRQLRRLSAQLRLIAKPDERNLT